MTTHLATAPPTPAQIDTLIANYEAQQALADKAQAVADSLEAEIVDYVRAYGTHPEGASQSLRLAGVRNQATVTMAVTRSLHVPSILKLRDYMKMQSLVYLFKKMFAEETRYTLIDGARDVFAEVDLPKTTREKALQLFGMCIDVKDRKPSLKVVAIKPAAVKQPRRKKAA